MMASVSTRHNHNSATVHTYRGTTRAGISLNSKIKTSFVFKFDQQVKFSTVESSQTKSSSFKTLLQSKPEVTLSSDGSKYQLTLGGKIVRTPIGEPIAFGSTRKTLALTLEREWRHCRAAGLKPYSLPLTSLLARCIDLEHASSPNCKPDLAHKAGADTNIIKNQLLAYLDTDTLLVFAPNNELDGELRKRQDSMYPDMIKVAERFLRQYTDSPAAIELRTLDCETDGIRGNAQNEEVRKAAKAYLDTMTPWNLAVFEKVVLTTKSFICAILLLQSRVKNTKICSDLQWSVDYLAQASNLEVICQTERWGEVEDTHDVNKRDIKRNLHSASLVLFEV